MQSQRQQYVKKSLNFCRKILSFITEYISKHTVTTFHPNAAHWKAVVELRCLLPHTLLAKNYPNAYPKCIKHRVSQSPYLGSTVCALHGSGQWNLHNVLIRAFFVKK